MGFKTISVYLSSSNIKEMQEPWLSLARAVPGRDLAGKKVHEDDVPSCSKMTTMRKRRSLRTKGKTGRGNSELIPPGIS